MNKGKTVYVTRYALSSGVITGTVDTESTDYWWVVLPGGSKDLFHKTKEVFLNLEDAIRSTATQGADVQNRIQSKRKSVQKQLQKLDHLEQLIESGKLAEKISQGVSRPQ